MIYYQQHIGDYLTETAHLTVLEDGSYRRMIDRYFTTEAPLAADEVALFRLLRARSDDEKDAVRVILQEFFIPVSEGWRHKRCEDEIAAYRERSAKSADAANRRWNKGAGAGQLDEAAAAVAASPPRQGDLIAALTPLPVDLAAEAMELGKSVADVAQVAPMAPNLPVVAAKNALILLSMPPHCAGIAEPMPTIYHLPLTHLPLTLNQQTRSKAEAASATRLPPGWQPSDEDIAFCQSNRPDLNPHRIADQFRDYWIAQPGVAARKTNWPAVWRNWVRKERGASQGRGSPPLLPMDVAAAQQAASDEARWLLFGDDDSGVIDG